MSAVVVQRDGVGNVRVVQLALGDRQRRTLVGRVDVPARVALDGVVGLLVAGRDRVDDVGHRDDPLERPINHRDSSLTLVEHQPGDLLEGGVGRRRGHVVHQHDELVLVGLFDQDLPRDQSAVLHLVSFLRDDRH